MIGSSLRSVHRGYTLLQPTGVGRLLSLHHNVNTRSFATAPAEKGHPTIQLHPYNRLKDIAKKLKVPLAKIEKKLVVKRRRNYFCNFDDIWFAFPSMKSIIIPFEAAALLAERYGKRSALIPLLEASAEQSSEIKLPVVAFLGHFNHGKTTLLDALAGTDYCSIEKHGITQIIRTKTIQLGGKQFTVVDTPGQDIFFRMRNYGASVADLVVLLVAADDGICPQTEESIGVAEGIGCPVIVCINKIDLPSLAPSIAPRIKDLTKSLREYISLEHADIVAISALNGTGLDVLGDTLVQRVASHMVDAAAQLNSKTLKKNIIEGKATRHATVLDSWTSQKDGTRLHVVVRSGTVKVNDWFTGGGWAGYVGGIQIDDDKDVEEVGPGCAAKLRVHVKHRYDPEPLAESIMFVDKDDAMLQAQQRTMEYSLASYAISPADAEDFQLEHYASHTLQHQAKLRAAGLPTSRTQRRAVAKEEEDEFIDDDGRDLNDVEEEEDASDSVSISGQPETNPDAGSSSEDPRKCVVIKADTAVSLGTMYDNLVELEDNTMESDIVVIPETADDSYDSEFLQSRRVIRGGIGIVSTADVMIAFAAGAPILTYGVHVDPHAARLAASKHVAIHEFDKMQDIIDILVGASDCPVSGFNLGAKKST